MVGPWAPSRGIHCYRAMASRHAFVVQFERYRSRSEAHREVVTESVSSGLSLRSVQGVPKHEIARLI